MVSVTSYCVSLFEYLYYLSQTSVISGRTRVSAENLHTIQFPALVKDDKEGVNSVVWTNLCYIRGQFTPSAVFGLFVLSLVLTFLSTRSLSGWLKNK